MSFYQRQRHRRSGTDRRHADRRGFAFDPIAPPPQPPPPSTLITIPAGLTPIGPAPYLFPAAIPRTHGGTLPDGWSWSYNDSATGYIETVNGVFVAHFLPGAPAGAGPGTFLRDHPAAHKHFMAFCHRFDAAALTQTSHSVKTHVLATASNGKIEPVIRGPDAGVRTFTILMYNGQQWPDIKYPGTMTNDLSRRANSGQPIQTVNGQPVYGLIIDPSKPHVIATLLDYAANRIQAWVDGVVAVDATGVLPASDGGIIESQIYAGLGGDSLPNPVQSPCAIYYGEQGTGVVLAGA